MELFKQRWSW